MDSLNNVLSMMDENATISASVGLFLVLYAGLAAPKLPRNVALLFDNYAFKLVIMFLIAYMSSKNSSIAIVATVALVVSMQTLSMYQTNDIIMDAVKNKKIVNEASETASQENNLSASPSPETVTVSEEAPIGKEIDGENAPYSPEKVTSETVSETVSEIRPEAEEFRNKANTQNNVTGYGSTDFAKFK
tara:strand:+ start:1486 stop:2052 length:567 start_codon:yes stop_codon:yes gene_type:complete